MPDIITAITPINNAIKNVPDNTNDITNIITNIIIDKKHPVHPSKKLSIICLFLYE